MYAVQMLEVTKKFGSFKANDKITLEVKKGEIHALLGENGAGKSTLMNLLFGFYSLDGGKILVNNKEVNITDPNIANELKIAMVHQHFKLVKPFSVMQNITLGNEPTKGIFLDYSKVEKKIKDIIENFDFKIDINSIINDLTVGQQQKVEILKMLYKDADILIFDEPTGALTPQETNELLLILKKLKNEGKTIILITHKLKEIQEVADRCTVIRKGKSIDTIDVEGVSEERLAELMVGRKVNFEVEINATQNNVEILKVDKLCVNNSLNIAAVKNVNFTLNSGEILGIAGVDGNGQIELADAIYGLNKIQSGEISFKNQKINNFNIRQRSELKLGYIPQDRQKYGVVLDFDISQNSILKNYFKKPFSKMGLLNFKKMDDYAEQIVADNDVRSPHGLRSSVRDMSGGNQQKLIIGRELAHEPDMLIAVQPTRGVDIGAIEFIHDKLLTARSQNKAIILVSLELDEILKLSDRIAVMFDGNLMGIVDRKDANEEVIGLMMAGKRGN